MNEILFGAHESPPDKNDYPFVESEALAGTVLGPTSSPSVLDAHAYRVQRFQDCVGYTCIEPVQALLAVLGMQAPELAALFPYGGSRLLTKPPKPGELLPDAGCNYRNALKWGRDEGYVSEALWPETDENVGLTPPKDVRDAGKSARMKTARRIIARTLEDFRAQLVAALRLAVAGKVTVPGFVMPVHDGYVALGSGIYEKPEGKLLGYHGQPIMGIDGPRDCALVPGIVGARCWGRWALWISIPCLYQIGSEFWIQEIDPSTFKVAA